MKKRKAIVCFVVGVILLVGYLLKDVRPGEPHYKRKALSVWLTGYDPWTGGRWMRSDEAVQAMGTNALPHLIKFLHTRHSNVETYLRVSVSVLFQANMNTDTDWHCRAMSACEVLGPIARPALPELTGHFFGRYPHLANSALVKVGPEGIAVLIGALSHEQMQIRYAAASALEFAPATNASAAAPALIRLLSEPHAEVRASAARTLSAFPDAAPLALAPLMECLQDRTTEVRKGAIYALGHYRTNAEPAVAELIRLFKEDPDDQVRFLARAYLYQINATAAREAGVDLNAPVRSNTRN